MSLGILSAQILLARREKFHQARLVEMQQAAMLSFIDVFHVLMIVVLLAMPLLLFMQGPQGGGETGRSARPRLGGE